jgi:hypothetical protein
MAKAELYIKNGSSWVNYNLLNAYPVGAIYSSANSTSPASLFGGSWTQITNAALRGATWVGYNGSDTHVLSINEMPKHSHQSHMAFTTDLGHPAYGLTPASGFQGYVAVAGYPNQMTMIDPSGGGAAHTNVQRSYNCYVWQRTS